MSPHAGAMLVNEIVPIIRVTVPQTVKKVSCDDIEELIADCIASAAAMLDAAERAGKTLIAKSVAYFAIQRTKSGRRSTSAGRTCVLASTTALDGNAVTESLDASMVDDNECCSLHEILADRGEDPARAATRRIDWCELPLSEREREIVEAITQSRSLKAIARRCQVSSPAITQAKRRLAHRIAEHWGDGILAEVASEPLWRCGIRAKHEHQRIRAERRNASPV